MDRSRSDHRLYEPLRRLAEPIKILLQMAIGVGIVGILAMKLLSLGLDQFLPTVILINWFEEGGFLDFIKSMIIDKLVLKLVSFGLALSAGVELAYMLFTPGPDEAVEPLILGLASTIFLITSGQGIERWEGALATLVLVASIVVLFWVRERFVHKCEVTRWTRPKLFPKRRVSSRSLPWMKGGLFQKKN